MKQNVIPALIIAAAILICGYFVRATLTTGAGQQLDAVLRQLETATQKQHDGSDSRVTKIIKGVSSSVADGFKAGLNESMNSSRSEEQNRVHSDLKNRDQLQLREIKLVPSQSKNQERVIGLIKNTSDQILTNVQLTILFKDKNGGLLDLGQGYVRGNLRPGEETGFEGNRTLGDYKEKDEVLNERRSASVVVTVSGCSAIKP